MKRHRTVQVLGSQAFTAARMLSQLHFSLTSACSTQHVGLHALSHIFPGIVSGSLLLTLQNSYEGNYYARIESSTWSVACRLCG